MQKTDILNRLDALGLDKHQYWVITGSAMVLYSIREQTHDIDLGCTAALADRLEKHGVPVIRQPDGGRKFTIGEDKEKNQWRGIISPIIVPIICGCLFSSCLL